MRRDYFLSVMSAAFAKKIKCKIRKNFRIQKSVRCSPRIRGRQLSWMFVEEVKKLKPVSIELGRYGKWAFPQKCCWLKVVGPFFAEWKLLFCTNALSFEGVSLTCKNFVPCRWNLLNKLEKFCKWKHRMKKKHPRDVK